MQNILLSPEIIRPSQLKALYGLSKSTVYREIERGNLPPPIRLSKRLVGWRKSTLDQWITEREGNSK